MITKINTRHTKGRDKNKNDKVTKTTKLFPTSDIVTIVVNLIFNRLKDLATF